MRCKECENHKQISNEEFYSLPYEKQRQLDCKTLVEDGQCDCRSKEHHPEEFDSANVQIASEDKE